MGVSLKFGFGDISVSSIFFQLSVKIFKDSGVTWEKVKGLTESLQELAPHVYLYSIAEALKEVVSGDCCQRYDVNAILSLSDTSVLASFCIFIYIVDLCTKKCNL